MKTQQKLSIKCSLCSHVTTVIRVGKMSGVKYCCRKCNPFGTIPDNIVDKIYQISKQEQEHEHAVSRLKKYKLKNITVEAMKLTKNNAIEVLDWLCEYTNGNDFSTNGIIFINFEGCSCKIKVGEYLVRHLEGFYSEKPDIFKRHYKLIEPTESEAEDKKTPEYTYTVISKYHRVSMEDEVSEYLQNGWVLQGNIATTKDSNDNLWVSQAMVREVKK